MSKDLGSSKNGSRRTSQEGSMSGSMRISHDFHGRHKGHGHGHHERKKGPQQELEDRLREEVAIRKKEHQLHAEMLAQAEEEHQKFEALHKQMRGKDYGYDCKGQVRYVELLPGSHVGPVRVCLYKHTGQVVLTDALNVLGKGSCVTISCRQSFLTISSAMSDHTCITLIHAWAEQSGCHDGCCHAGFATTFCLHNTFVKHATTSIPPELQLKQDSTNC